MTPFFKARMAYQLRHIVRFHRNDDGTASIEFVLLFPLFFFMFVSAFEMGLMMTRNVMLERGLDLAVRAVRLGTTTPGAVSADDLKQMICNGAGIIPDCLNQVTVEMNPIDPFDWSEFHTDAVCVDRDEPAVPAREIQVVSGVQNELMLLRVCALIDPLFPTTGIGFHLPKQSGGAIALYAMSAFVMEP